MADASRRVPLRVLASITLVVVALSSGTDASRAAPVASAASVAGTSSGPLPTPEPTPAQADARADEILGQPEYQTPPKSMIDRGRTTIGEALGRLLESLLSGGVGSVVGWIILVVLGGVVAFLLSRLGRSMQRDPVRHQEEILEPRRTSTDWRTEAERRETEGDWKGALRCRYRSLVSDLVQREVLRDIPGRTTGEYRVELASAEPEVAGEFAGASELFERAWYGDLPTGPDENGRFRELADDVIRGVK